MFKSIITHSATHFFTGVALFAIASLPGIPVGFFTIFGVGFIISAIYIVTSANKSRYR